jgi:MarR family 2-MHQ and catechol resistance regulon transcriptional repressor
MKERYLKSVRLLSECYHAFEQLSASHVRGSGLTPSQFDILATLGNTQGMCFRELGMKTLITKGTLTGVVDRMEQKGLVRRSLLPDDRRMTMVQLTPQGEQEFARLFAPHIAFCRQSFQHYRGEDFDLLEGVLATLQQALTAARGK